jgi:hypothetical protein
MAAAAPMPARMPDRMPSRRLVLADGLPGVLLPAAWKLVRVAE